MNTELTQCPLCEFEQEFRGSYQFDYGTYACRCPVCGDFVIGEDAVDDRMLQTGELSHPILRALLSHRVRQATDAGRDRLLISSSDFAEFVREKPRLPTAAEQANNIIRFIGKHVEATGEPLRSFPVSFGAKVGSPNRPSALKLARELLDAGLIVGTRPGTMKSPNELIGIDLTLPGWQQFEADRRGQISGRYGFIAMKFNDAVLEPFVRDVVKPEVQKLGYELLDMRDAARAGVIDNLLREQIRDAAFLLVDLTHDNPGAYWEAGYAEGLGKPVLYICERQKFEAHNTHFDTNHCTTVLWHPDEPLAFQQQLTATLRRSLGLFSA